MVVITALLTPVLWMASGSLMDLLTLWSHPPRLIPLRPTLENYERLLSARGSAGGQLWQLGGPLLVPRWSLNTFSLTVVTTLASVLITAAAGYALPRGALYTLVAASLIVPGGALLIPLFRVVRALGIQGTLLAAALPHMYWPLGILLYHAYLSSFPTMYLDAARLDGASEGTVVVRILLPMTAPALGAMALLKALEILGDFVWQFLQLTRPGSHTLLVGLVRLSKESASYGLPNPAGAQMAAGMLALVPVIVVFLVLRRYLANDIPTGGIR